MDSTKLSSYKSAKKALKKRLKQQSFFTLL